MYQKSQKNKIQTVPWRGIQDSLPDSEAWALTCCSYEQDQKHSCLWCWQTCTAQAGTLHLLSTGVGSSPQTRAGCDDLGSRSSPDLMRKRGNIYLSINLPQTAEWPPCCLKGGYIHYIDQGHWGASSCFYGLSNLIGPYSHLQTPSFCWILLTLCWLSSLSGAIDLHSFWIYTPALPQLHVTLHLIKSPRVQALRDVGDAAAVDVSAHQDPLLLQLAKGQAWSTREGHCQRKVLAGHWITYWDNIWIFSEL